MNQGQVERQFRERGEVKSQLVQMYAEKDCARSPI
jgi:hypothetical protein